MSIYRAQFEIGLLRESDEYYIIGPWWVGDVRSKEVEYFHLLEEVMEFIQERS